MMFATKTKILLGLALLGLSVLSYAEDLKLWQVAEKAPIFYQEPANTSQKLSPLKPNQTMVILREQKDWVKLANLTNGETGWVAQDQVKQTAIINLMVNKSPHAYQYQVQMRSGDAQQTGAWSIKGGFFEQHAKTKKKSLKEKLGFKKKSTSQKDVNDLIEKEFEAMEKRFATIRASGFVFPMIQPVFIVAENKVQNANKPATPTTKTAPAIKETSTQSG